MSKEQKGFIIYKDLHAVVDELTDEQAGQLLRGMISYFNEGIEPHFEGILKFVFIPIKQQMDRDSDKYDAKCEKNRNSIKSYWDKVKGDNERIQTNTNEYERIQTYTNATNTNTNTKTNTKTNKDTNTTTTTNTNTKAGGGGVCDDDSLFTDIWKAMTPQDVDKIYDVYPNSADDLIQAVHDDVKQKRKTVKKPVQYILGFAKRIGWDDNAEHFDY